MKNANTKAVILGHKNFGQYDKLVFLYSENLGKIKCIAKGSRKINSKFTGHLETMNLVNVSLYYGPRNIILREITTEKTLKEIREDYEKIKQILEIAEITNRMIFENQSLKDLNLLIDETIEQFKKTRRPRQIKQGYQIKLLDKMGLIPNFKQIETNIDSKYLKFLNYLKLYPLSEIEKIKLEKKEEENINKIIERLFALTT